MYKKAFIIIIAISVVGGSWGLISDPPKNPPVQRQVSWDSHRTERLFNRACADCHSYSTNWPWYSTFPPASFLLARNVEKARSEFNISAQKIGEAEEAAEEVLEGEMPPWDYVLLHPEARLTSQEQAALVDGLEITFGLGKEDDDEEENETQDDNEES